MDKHIWPQHEELSNLLVSSDEIRSYEELLKMQSLTKGLEMLNANLSVKLLYLGELVEQKNNSVNLFSRKVELCLDGIPVVWAESLCGAQSDFWRDYLNCGTQPLGKKLFNGDQDIQRSLFSYRLFTVDQLPFALNNNENEVIIARHSEFIHERESLYLTEYFLPDLKIWIKKTV